MQVACIAEGLLVLLPLMPVSSLVSVLLSPPFSRLLKSLPGQDSRILPGEPQQAGVYHCRLHLLQKTNMADIESPGASAAVLRVG